tara:strand:- start:15358 stop:15786 length:429 start_codon:yes stop_codon:yes gene_type:complete
MKKYKFLPDIAVADIAFEAYGKTLPELFVHCAEAIFVEMVDFTTVEAKEMKEFSVEGDTIEQALYNFLEELIYLKDVEVMVFKEFKVQIVEGKPIRVHAEVKGEEINQKKHKLGNDVKAVTMHQFEVKKEKRQWVARIIIDI